MTDSAPLPDDWAEGRVEANGVELHYVRTGGEGPPLVVAHGVFDDGRCRVPLVRELADEYDVVAYDACGHGRSDAPEEGYWLADRVADLVGLVDALDLDDPYLFGHSMGGDTVAATAARHPGLPRAVVMVDPAGMLRSDETPDDWDVRAQIEWWHDHTKEELLEADEGLRAYVEDGREELASLLADARLRVSPNIAALFDADWVDPAETYPDIEAPTLILRADADEAGRERERDLAAHLPDGRLVHVDGAGHTVFRDARETATAALRRFLREV